METIFSTCTIDAVGRVSAKRRSPDSVAIELSGYRPRSQERQHLR